MSYFQLLRGEKIGDFSEFEEEEVNLQNLIGSKKDPKTTDFSARSQQKAAATNTFSSASSTSTSSRNSRKSFSPRTSAFKDAENGFDVDF
jgi:hypothetical protein